MDGEWSDRCVVGIGAAGAGLGRRGSFVKGPRPVSRPSPTPDCSTSTRQGRPPRLEIKATKGVLGGRRAAADTVGAAIVGDRQVIKCAAFGTSAGVIVDDLPESHMFTCAEYIGGVSFDD
jgi:hypothetical protein